MSIYTRAVLCKWTTEPTAKVQLFSTLQINWNYKKNKNNNNNHPPSMGSDCRFLVFVSYALNILICSSFWFLEPISVVITSHFPHGGVISFFMLSVNKNWKNSSWRLNWAREWNTVVPSYRKWILVSFSLTMWLVSDTNGTVSAWVDPQGCVLLHSIIVAHLLYYKLW